MRRLVRRLGVVLAGLWAAVPLWSQTTALPQRGREVQVNIDGFVVAPVRDQPFSMTVEVTVQRRRNDGTALSITTVNHLARSSSGVIRNEQDMAPPPNEPGEWRPESLHIVDAGAQVDTFCNLRSHTAAESSLPSMLHVSKRSWPSKGMVRWMGRGNFFKDEQTQVLNGVVFELLRSTQVTSGDSIGIWGHPRWTGPSVPSAANGKEQSVTIVDDVWYSPVLGVAIPRYDNPADPFTRQMTLVIKDVRLGEPPAEKMTVPPGYTLVPAMRPKGYTWRTGPYSFPPEPPTPSVGDADWHRPFPA